MTTSNAPVATQVIAVAGSSSLVGSRILLHLESESPDCRLVALDNAPLRWPVHGASAHRMGRDYAGENVTVDDIPDLLELESVDSLIYVGSHYDGAEPASFLEQTPRWVDASRRAGVRQFIYLSDYRVYGIKPGQPMPVTERADTDPMPAHRRLAHAEPKSRRPQNIPAPPEEMRVAVIRTAMTVGPSGASPAAVEFFARPIRPGGKQNPPLQFLHEYDLARAVSNTINHRLYGIYNLAGDKSIFLHDVASACQSALPRANRSGESPGSGPAPSLKNAGDPTQHPVVISNTKFKQEAHFNYKYSSGQAFRAYCHSVLMEPDPTR